MYRTVSEVIRNDEEFDYDMIILFTPSGVKSLMQSFPHFEQGNIAIGAMGSKTIEELKNNGLRLDLTTSPKAPSIAAAMDLYIKDHIDDPDEPRIVQERFKDNEPAPVPTPTPKPKPAPATVAEVKEEEKEVKKALAKKAAAPAKKAAAPAKKAAAPAKKAVAKKTTAKKATTATTAKKATTAKATSAKKTTTKK